MDISAEITSVSGLKGILHVGEHTSAIPLPLDAEYSTTTARLPTQSAPLSSRQQLSRKMSYRLVTTLNALAQPRIQRAELLLADHLSPLQSL